MSSNNRSYSTNRFLSKTNPQFIRGLADSGSVLDSPEINKLAAQMVDLGIWGNLLFWVHEGLVKERVSGSDVFVPKAYDITGNNRDVAQTNTNFQPKLISGFIDFDGVNDGIGITTSYSNAATSYSCYIKTRSALASSSRIWETNGDRIWYALIGPTNYAINYVHVFASSTSRRAISTDTLNFNTWYHVAITYNASSTANNPIIYVNGTDITNIIDGTPSGTRQVSNSFSLGNANFANISTFNRPNDGLISDFRKFDKILSSTEIDAIFQATRGKYGI